MQSADPAQVEQIHRDAFARLTPDQGAQVHARMASALPVTERPGASRPEDLARSAARTEAMNPGSMRRLLGGAGIGAAAGVGVAAVGGLLAAVAGGAILSSVAGSLLSDAAGLGIDIDQFDASALTDGAGEAVSGLGDQISGFGDQLGDFGLGGFFD